MSFLLTFALVFLLSVPGHGQQTIKETSLQVEELTRLNKELEKAATLRAQFESAAGAEAAQLRVQESKAAEAVASYLKKNPNLMFLQEGKLAAQWFHWPSAMEPRYQWLVSAYLGRQQLIIPSMTLENHLKKLGIRSALQMQFWAQGNRSHDMTFHEWIYELADQWLREQRALILEGGEKNWSKVFDSLVRNIDTQTLSSGIYNQLIKKLPAEKKADVTNFLFDHYKPQLRFSFFYQVLDDWNPRDLLRMDAKLFRQMIHAGGTYFARAEKLILTWFSVELFTSRINVVELENLDPRLYTLTERAQGLTVAEQLVLTSREYANIIYGFLANEANRLWMVELIDFGLKNGYTDLRTLGTALAQSFAIEDPRWIEWMKVLDSDVRKASVNSFVRSNSFFTLFSPEQVEIHKLILQDAVELVQQKPFFNTTEVNPLNEYLMRGTKNPPIFMQVIMPSMKKVFAIYDPKIWQPYLKFAVLGAGVDDVLRHFLIDFITPLRVTDIEILRYLNNFYGVPEGFLEDIERAEKNSEMERELRQMALDQALFEMSKVKGLFRCQEIFF